LEGLGKPGLRTVPEYLEGGLTGDEEGGETGLVAEPAPELLHLDGDVSPFTVVANGGAPQTQVTSDGGTWARVGANIAFTSPTSGTSNATFNGTTLTLTDVTLGTGVYSR
jgi:hypothetical protein